MPLFKRDTSHNPPPGWDTELYGVAASRAAKRETYELYAWAEVALGAMGAALNEYRANSNADHLYDMRNAMLSMWAMLIELGVRDEADRQLRT